MEFLEFCSWGNTSTILLSSQAMHGVAMASIKIASFLLSWIKLRVLVTLGLYLLFLFHFVVQPRYIDSRSMYPTIEPGDSFLIDMISYRFVRPEVHDIVFFRPPAAIASSVRHSCYVKRVVAMAGDVVEVAGGKLVVNGNPRTEVYTAEPRLLDMRPVMVPDGHVFVMGDNRNHSFDSCNWGPLPVTDIIGRLVMRYSPFRRFGTLAAENVDPFERRVPVRIHKSRSYSNCWGMINRV